MKKIKFLFTGNFELNGRDRHFVKGEITDAEEKDADRLIVGLCAIEYHGEVIEVTSLTDEKPVYVEAKPRKSKKDGE